MKNPLVSIIIPIYNAEDYLEETIRSVLTQTYENFELILVNHNATDKSLDIIDSFKQKDRRIKVITLSINKGGPAYPRNEGLKIAKGECIAFLDADDVWLKDKLKKQLNFMLKNNLNISSTNVQYIDKCSQTIDKTIKDKILGFITKEHDFNALLVHNFIINSSVMMDKECLHNLSFDEDKIIIAIEDYVLWIELFLHNYSYGYLDNILLQYRILDNSTVQRDNKIKNQARRNYALSKLCFKYENQQLLNSLYKNNSINYIKGFFF